MAGATGQTHCHRWRSNPTHHHAAKHGVMVPGHARKGDYASRLRYQAWSAQPHVVHKTQSEECAMAEIQLSSAFTGSSKHSFDINAYDRDATGVACVHPSTGQRCQTSLEPTTQHRRCCGCCGHREELSLRSAQRSVYASIAASTTLNQRKGCCSRHETSCGRAPSCDPDTRQQSRRDAISCRAYGPHGQACHRASNQLLSGPDAGRKAVLSVPLR